MPAFCCDQMTDQVSRLDPVAPEGPRDKLITYSRVFNEYGIPIYDGEGGTSTSQVQIRFCPWCGRDLGASYRMAWFDVLDALGIEDALGVTLDPARSDDVPARLLDDGWWRDRPSERPPPSDDTYEGGREPVRPVDPATRHAHGGLRLSKTNPCCESMRYHAGHVCPDHPDPWECPDNLIGFDSGGRVGLIIHDTEAALDHIAHCPWCGTATGTAR